MANNNNAHLTVAADPLFYGKNGEHSHRNAVSAEAFLERMNNIRNTLGLAPAAAIQRCIANFRDNAEDWYTNVVRFSLAAIDEQQFLNYWDYFCQTFRKRFFLEQDERDTTADITDLKQASSESTYDFGYRLIARLCRISTRCLDGTLQTQPMQNPENVEVLESNIVPALHQHVVDPVANPLAGVDRLALLNQSMQAAARWGAKRREHHSCFEAIARVLARNARDAYMRTFIRGTMLTVDKDIVVLLDRVAQEERKHLPILAGASRVSAVSPVDSDDGASNDEGEYSEGEDVHVDAIRTNKKKQSKNKNKKAANTKKPVNKDSVKPQGSYKCNYCRLDSHETKVCRKLRRELNLPFQGMLTTTDSAPKHPYFKKQNKWTGGRQEEPMDTSAVQAGGSGQPPPHPGYQQQPIYQQGHYQPQPNHQPVETIQYFKPQPVNQDVFALPSGNANGSM